MRNRGAVPKVAIEADLILKLEAPADEPTLPGGLHGPDAPYVEIALATTALGLDEALSRWESEVWGGEA